MIDSAPPPEGLQPRPSDAPERHAVLVERAWRICVRNLGAAAAPLEELAREGHRLTTGNRWQTGPPGECAEFDCRAIAAIRNADQVLSAARDLLGLTGREPCTPPGVRDLQHEAIARFDRVTRACARLRHQLFASEMGQRAAAEATVDEALIDWKLEDTSDNRWALRHVLTRKPRGSKEARWRQVMRQTSHEGFLRWVNKSVRGAVNDLRRSGAPADVTDDSASQEQSIEILALLNDPSLSHREAEILAAVSRGASIAEAARRMGISPATGRVLMHRARQKLRRTAS